MTGRVHVLGVILIGDLVFGHEPFAEAHGTMKVVDISVICLFSSCYEPVDYVRMVGFECGQALLGPAVFLHKIGIVILS